MSREPTHPRVALPTSRSAARWQALASMPLTGTILLLALVMVLASGASSSAADDSHGGNDTVAPAAFVEPKVPEPESATEPPRPRRVLDLAVAPLDGQLFLLQPIEVVDLVAPGDST